MKNEERRMKNSRNRKDSTLHAKSYAFALRIIGLAKFLREQKQDFVLCKQILRSGTAIGALVRESEFAQSPSDFASKLHIALKEANETMNWLNLLYDTECIQKNIHESMTADCGELIAILVSSIKTVKKNNPK